MSKYSKVNNFKFNSQLFPGDLFDMLLPMLSIYQEYVRNHHYSLQVRKHLDKHRERSLYISDIP